MKRLRPLRAYGPLLRERPGRTALAILLTVVATLSEGLALVVLIPLISGASGSDFGGENAISRAMVDLLDTVGVRPTLGTVIALFSVMASGSALCTFASGAVTRRITNNTEATLRRSLFDELFHMRWGALSGAVAGQVTKSVLQDTQFASYGVYYLLMATTNALAALTYVAISFLVSLPLTLMALGFAAAMTPAFVTLTRRGKRSSREASSAMETLSARLLDAVGNAKFVVAQNLFGFFNSSFRHATERYRVERNRNELLNVGLRAVFELGAVVFVAVYLFVSMRALDQSVAVALVFLVIFYRLGPKILSVQDYLFRAISHAVWLEDTTRLRDTARLEAEHHTGTTAPTLERGLELRGVTFRHTSSGRPIVDDVSLDVPAGGCVAVVGPSGQGKTTLLDLIAALHKPEAGTITVDGVPLDDIDLAAWRSALGIVLQDSPIFNASVRDNIVLDRSVDDAQLARVCDMAGVTRFVTTLGNGYDTVVGERGSQISGGQRQRIALARALYRDPLLLILDEPTSSLDEDSEQLIIDTLASLKGSVTMLVVTHGTSVLSIADRVYRLDAGRLSTDPQPGTRSAR